MRLFFDTSAFAKRYIKEDGTKWVLDLCEQAGAIGLAVYAYRSSSRLCAGWFVKAS